ncbi:MAG: Stp1/IreP family PP2C-type Ser/Thr phosphatase [Clostridia bacterium]|nr:Stp1/IreP family PP2C-type Ser/Thr phosphatase [Clostridia bacterium]
MVYCANTDVGRVRTLNEDSYIVKEYGEDAILTVIADGMGGHNAGEKASRIAVDCFVKRIDENYSDIFTYSDRKILQTMKKVVSYINEEIYSMSIKDSSLYGMGTTIVACLVIKNKYYVVNVGDSRLYHLSKSSIFQITKDHSYVAELLDIGVITKEQALVHPKKNVITRAIGTESTVESDGFSGVLKNNECLLLCTDGLTNMLNDEFLFETFSNESDIKKISAKLLDKSNAMGGIDNITFIILKNEERGTRK